MKAPGESLAELRATAEEAARCAGRVLAERFEGARTIEYKSGRHDLVTDADRAAEEALLRLLRERYPGHAILAEESGLSQGARMRWLVDPLDGTTNYAHRIPHFCTSVAVEGPDGLLAGAVYDAMRDELFSAARGQGATLNGRPLSTSAVQALDHALLSTGIPYYASLRPEAPVGLLTRVVRRAQGLRRMGSAALDLAYVAAGRFDGHFEFGLKPWDIAAGALLVREAGGVVTRIDGAPLDLAVGDMLACCPGIATELAAVCAGFVADSGWKPG